MANESQGSQNPADRGTLSGVFREVLGKFLSGVDDMLPAVVISYDREENRAEVRPLVRLLKTDNTLLDRAVIASVPVLNIGGGNAVLSFNILPGDLGWIKANDRDISLFLQSMVDAPPNTLRKHSFNDGLFIPDQFKKWTLNAEDDSFAVLQTLDGTQRISIQDTQIKITSNALITLDAPLVDITGGLNVAGDVDAIGEVTGNGIPLSTHRNTGVTPGGGTSGGPVA